jgi:N-acyl amino acid synthase of PEP-CTERM/exosortase system
LNEAAFLALAAGFQRRFRVVPADTATLRDVCYRLRHAVYCQEFAFEPEQNDGRESDEWDAESIHCLVQHVITGEYVGCARLVVPPLVYPRTPLPFERVCAGAIDPALVDPQRLPRASIAEVSRLAVISDFRRYGRKTAPPSAQPERILRTQERTAVSCVLTGLCLGLIALARVYGIDTLFMLVEPRLARYLGILTGCRPQVIGCPVEHRGPRVPAMLGVPEILDRFNVLLKPLVAAISADIRGPLPYNKAGNFLRSVKPVIGERETVALTELAA